MLSLIKLVSDVDLLPYSTLLIILTLLISQSIVFAGLRQSSIHYSPEEWQLVRGSSAVARKSIGTSTETNPEVVQDDGSNGKYAHSSLDEAGAQDIWDRLGDYMEQQKPHLEPELKISDLATALALSVDHISQTLNRHGRENFHEFINRHRIEYAKLLLRSNEHGQRKMLDIAMESGFNSQSTFYSYFKKYQQQTPAAFRAEQLKRYREVNESTTMSGAP